MKRVISFAGMSAWLAVSTASAEVKLHALFSDNAVLQQTQPMPVWGTAKDGEKVTVSFAGQTVSTIAKDGRWQVALQPLKANATPQSLTVVGENTLTRTNMLVGEVWICSGQSNMEMGLRGAAGARAAIAAANDPLLRLITIPRLGKAEPQQNVEATWTDCTSANVGAFSAVGYFFGCDLRKARGVPVGLISSTVGGTAAERWISREALSAEPSLKYMFDAQSKTAQEYSVALGKYKKEEPELLKIWEAEVEKAKAEGRTLSKRRKPMPPVDPVANGVCSLYNAMISPLQPFAIAGVIWYQGESNADRAKEYQTLFPAMIKCWRDGWSRPDLPFLFVQIATYGSHEIQEAQLLTWKRVPGTAMAVITDCGADVHPQNKAPVGARLALAARAVAYGEKIEYSGPVYESFKVDSNKVIISFSHVGNGLVGGELKGFTITGTDPSLPVGSAAASKKFVPATAIIEGETVVVSSPEVAQPIAVRYGWANVPDVNLFNKAGLPATPFRTDVE